MADFINTIMECRNGEVAVDLNRKFNEVLEAVREVGGSGELSMKFKIKPVKSKGGKVLEISIEHETKMKRPEMPVGPATFFVTDDGDLVRDNPAQAEMFADLKKEIKDVR